MISPIMYTFISAGETQSATMPPRSGTSDGSETSPPRDQHKVTPGNGMIIISH